MEVGYKIFLEGSVEKLTVKLLMKMQFKLKLINSYSIDS